jgi:predicted Fe-Mo cluster-binding NifX family protein
MKKIAIPTKNNYVDSHFGHTDEFQVFTIQEGVVKDTERVDSSQGCGCRSNIIGILKEKGISVMLAGNMGDGAFQKLNAAGIEVIRGCRGKVEKVLEKYQSGHLVDDGSHCQTHRQHHHTRWE